MSMLEASLEILRGLFDDKPEALKVFDLQNLESEYLKDQIRNNGELFADPINLWVTGRTGAGKTSLGNSLLNSQVMKSNGFQDCTDFIGYFQLASNLRFWDTPGVASDYAYENINRAALLLPQKEPKKYGKNPGKPLQTSDFLTIKDFTKCTSPKDRPEVEEVTVGKWQSEQMQNDVAPDVILYVLAPDKQFLEPDEEYFGLLLETWKERYPHQCVVIPVLNKFRDERGNVKPTPQNIHDAREGITRVYQAVYDTQNVLPIVEINSKTGAGIPQLTEIICQILPPEKIGGLGNVLQDDLKHYAEKERVNRYYKTLSLISGRLSRYKVDEKLEGQSIVQAAASAICAYGVMTFKSLDEIADITAQFDSVVEQVEQVEASRREDITTKEHVMGTQDITRIKPKTEEVEEEYKEWRPEEVTETLEEDIYVPRSRTKTLKEEQLVPKSHNIWRIDKWGTTEYDKQILEKEVETIEHVKQTVTKQVKSTKWKEENKKKVETRIVGYEEEVVDTVQVVVAEVDKVVGTKHLAGGYPAIEFLLSLGLGIQNYCGSTNTGWSTCIEKGKLVVERKLGADKSRIEQLVDDPNGEQELIQILEHVLIG